MLVVIILSLPFECVREGMGLDFIMVKVSFVSLSCAPFS